MANTFSNSWQLLKQSFRVIGLNKKLLIFPLFGLSSMGFVVVIGLLPIINVMLSGTFDASWVSGLFDEVKENHYELNAYGVAYSLLIYFSLAIVSTFSKVAFYHQIFNALNQRKVSIKNGYLLALSKIDVIIIWAIFSWTIGLLLRMLKENTRKYSGARVVQSIIASVTQVAWNVAIIFAVPVIIDNSKNYNPFSIVKESANTLKQAWGETLVGIGGIKLMSMLWFPILMVGLFVGDYAYKAIDNKEGDLMLFIISFGFIPLLLVFFQYLISIANNIYRCAVYQFAKDQKTPSAYTEEMLNSALRFKKDV